MPPCTWMEVSHTVRADSGTVGLGHRGGAQGGVGRQGVDGPGGMPGHAGGALHHHVRHRPAGAARPGTNRCDRPNWWREPGVVDGEFDRPPHGADQVGTGQGQSQGQPSGQVVGGEGSVRRGLHHRGRRRRAGGGPSQVGAHLGNRQGDPGQPVARAVRHQHQGGAWHPGHRRPGRRRGAHPSPGDGQRLQGGAEADGLRCVGDRSAGTAAQLRGQGRAEERHVGQTPPQLLGDDRRLDARRQRAAVPSGLADPQLPPARRGHRGVQLVGPLGIGQPRHRTRTPPVDYPGRSTAQFLLFGGEAGVHQGSTRVPASRGVHSSRSVRRSTFPEGSLGMASTTTT